MFDTFLEASAILHTILGVLVGFLLLYLGNAWSASTILEKRERIGHIVGERLIMMHLYTTYYRSSLLIECILH